MPWLIFHLRCGTWRSQSGTLSRADEWTGTQFPPCSLSRATDGWTLFLCRVRLWTAWASAWKPPQTPPARGEALPPTHGPGIRNRDGSLCACLYCAFNTHEYRLCLTLTQGFTFQLKFCWSKAALLSRRSAQCLWTEMFEGFWELFPSFKRRRWIEITSPSSHTKATTLRSADWSSFRVWEHQMRVGAKPCGL